MTADEREESNSRGTRPSEPIAAPAFPGTDGLPNPAMERRVLLVEDNECVRFMLRSALELLGHVVDEASEGLGALEAGEKFRPDVILIDLGLPGMDGCEVARRVRDTTWGKESMLVAVTGFGQPEYRRRAMQSGFDRYVLKPIEVDNLATLVAQAPRAHLA
jgi:CheY-like chemotaxis protein